MSLLDRIDLLIGEKIGNKLYSKSSGEDKLLTKKQKKLPEKLKKAIIKKKKKK